MKVPAYIGLFRTSPSGVWTVYFPDLPGCTAEGDGLEHALAAAKAALAEHLSELSWDAPRSRSSAELLEAAQKDWCLAREFVDAIMYLVDTQPYEAVPTVPAFGTETRLPAAAE